MNTGKAATDTVTIIEAWEQRKREAQKHAVSRTLQLYLDKRYFVAIEQTGHTSKPQDFIKEAILSEAQRRFNSAITVIRANESDKERADRLQSELITTEAKLNDLLQAMQKICSSISV